MSPSERVIALAGQPNCGKSSVFNMLTGAHQHIANYPGITVDVKEGFVKIGRDHRKIVDLPGMYSLSSFSDDERAAREFILEQKPGLIVNVVDASNLERHLYLTLQLIETGLPVVVDLNMMDLARRSGVLIDEKLLEKDLGSRVVATEANRSKGKRELADSIVAVSSDEISKVSLVDYEELSPAIENMTDQLEKIKGLPLSPRWIAVKLLEEDEGVRQIISEIPGTEKMLDDLDVFSARMTESLGVSTSQYIALKRHQAAKRIASRAVRGGNEEQTFSDRVDKIVIHPVAGLFILAGVMFSLYELAIVQGYKLTAFTWPLLARVSRSISLLLPGEDLISDSLFRTGSLYVLDGITAVLNYIPIFFILFALIAILEDGGYMPRMSFVLDRLFRRFGLHGQSVLPLVLGGVFVGGCAVPGVMATRGIPDRRARLATIMVVPLMNCLAKIPFYTLLVNIYFPMQKSFAMFFIATITLITGLVVSKVLTLTVLKHEPSAPFIMEMPPYHIPALKNVLHWSIHRTWVFLRKIFTVVVVASAVIFALTRFPSISTVEERVFLERTEKALASFREQISDTGYGFMFAENNSVLDFLDYWQRYRNERRMTGGNKASIEALNRKFVAENEEFFEIMTAERGIDAGKVNLSFMNFTRTRMQIRNERERLQIEESLLGMAGRGLEKITRYAGFNWRINVALLSSFAAKENVVATLGSIYRSGEDGERLETRMSQEEQDITPLHALAMMVFMAMYPPCIATLLVVLTESGSLKWMLLTLFYPLVLGLCFAIAIFSGGSAMGFDGMQAMVIFYCLMFGSALLLSRIEAPVSTGAQIERR